MSKSIILKLKKHEEKLSELYGIYADLFPSYKEFWEELSYAEENHAIIIQDLLERVDNKAIFINSARFKERPLEISLEYIQEMIDKALNTKITLLGALSIANTMESAIIDSKFFEIFSGNSASLNKYLQKIHQETKEHRASIKKMQEIARKS